MNKILDILRKILVGLVFAAAVTYAFDFLWLHWRMRKPTTTDPFQSMTVQGVIEVPHKDGKYEIILQDPQNVTCVHSLFPHAGYSPCWYVVRQNSKATQM